MCAANGRGSRPQEKGSSSPGCGRRGWATTRCRRPTSRSSPCCATCCSSAERITTGDVCRADRAAPAKSQGKRRLGPFIAHDRPAVRADYRLALKIGQFPVAWRTLEVIADKAVLLAHIAGPIQRLGGGVICRLLVQGGPGVGSRGHHQRHCHGKKYRSRIPKPL